MKITVVLTPWFTEVTGVDQQVVELSEGACIEELMQILIRDFGTAFERLIVGPSRLSGMIILRNGGITKSMSEKLADGDTISFIVPLSGG